MAPPIERVAIVWDPGGGSGCGLCLSDYQTSSIARMSVEGQSRRFLGACYESGLPPIADRRRGTVGYSSVP